MQVIGSDDVSADGWPVCKPDLALWSLEEQ